MEIGSAIVQLIVIVAVVLIAIAKKNEKWDKNDWGKGPLSFIDIFSAKDTVNTQQKAKLEVHADDLYLYVLNKGKTMAKRVVVHSKDIEAIDIDTDGKGMIIQPNEQITYLINTFEHKSIKHITLSWTDSLGRHKRSFLVKTRKN